ASGVFVNQQWLWFNIAAMSASLIGGGLIEILAPTSALHAAALIAGLTPIVVMFGTIYLVDEERTRVDLPELKSALRGLAAAFRSRELWVVGLYLFFYYFSPGFATPL